MAGFEHPLPLPARGTVIALKGARVHNLRSVSVDVPHGRFVVCTGVSGSGKSSLAFDTLFAEGRRQCLEALAGSARHRLEQLPRPEFDSLTGLPPVVAVAQRNAAGGPRSTLATLTEIASFLRLLYARGGTAHCPQCNAEVKSQSIEQIADAILALETGRKVILLAPRARGRKGEQRELLESIMREGFVRARIDGVLIDAASPPKLAKSKPHDVEIVIDRVIVKEGLRSRLLDSVALALKHGLGDVIVSQEVPGGWSDRLFSSRHACPQCRISLPELEPRTLNFNTPQGACPTCTGLGRVQDEACPECRGTRLGPVGRGVTFMDVPLTVLHALTVDAAQAAVGGWTGLDSPVARRIVPELLCRLQFLEQVGLDYLTLDRPLATLSGGELQRARLEGALGSGLAGVCYILDEPTIGLHPRDTRRLLNALLALRDRGNTLLVVEHDPLVMREAEWLIDLGPGAGSEGGHVVAEGTVEQVASNPRSVTGRWLAQPGLALLGPKRSVDPTRRLRVEGAAVRNLQSLAVDFPLGVLTCVTGVSGSGKSSLVVESLAPLVRESLRRRDTRTPVPPPAPPASPPPARPKRGKTGGSRPRGKAPDTESPAAVDLSSDVESPGLGRLRWADQVRRLVEVDQSPLGRSYRANPATLSGIWTELRRLLARTRDARRLGFGAQRFSTQAPAGRCAACRGLGVRTIEVELLPEARSVCPVCRGSRFNPQTLEVRFLERNAAQWLQLQIAEALPQLANFDKLRRTLQTFVDVGLGYLGLGQPAATLSGGEAQRVKLACELAREGDGHTLYVLDEPTTGLHPADVARLLDVLQRLVDRGNTVLVIEHHLELIASADWVIDLGPEGGRGGGRLVAEGTPAQIADRGVGWTAEVLRELKRSTE